MTHPRPFRFGVQVGSTGSAEEWREAARRAEALGYDILLAPDHIGGRFAYAPALMAAAAVTTTLRIGPLVLDNDFRHPALTASEAATLDVLSEGRYELGIGAGWMLEDYERTGIPFDPPGVRVSRFQESVRIIKGLFGDEPVTFSGEHYTVTDLEGFPKPAQQPHPPLLLGAGGKRMLSFAAREADIVSLIPLALPQGGLSLAVDAQSVADQVDHLRAAAGERFNEIELNILNQVLEVTDTPRPAVEALSERWGLSPEDIEESPHVMIGSVESIIESLLERRERFGISYVVIRLVAMEDFAPVVARLRGA